MTLFSPLFPSAAMLAFAMAFLPTLSQGQECSQGRIGEVEVIRLDVFEVEAESEGTLVGWALRTANRIHINTTEGYIRSELFFEEGDCFDPFLLEESARTLRSRVFIIWAEISSEPLPDGEIKVTVEVRDDWTLELGLGLSFDEGVNLEELLLQETNLFGRGLNIGAFRVQAREILETSVRFGAARLFGTPWTLDAQGGETRNGPFFEGGIAFPFTSELSRTAVKQDFSYREDYFPYTTSGVENPTHVLLPYQQEFLQLSFARRFGEAGALWLLGGGFSRENLEFPEGLDGVRAVLDEEFGELIPGTDEEMQKLAGQATSLGATRLNFFGGFRNITFVLRDGLDAVMAPQDVMVGTEVTVSLNPAIPVFAGDDDAEDVHGRLDFSWAAAPGPWVLSTDVQAEGRFVRNGDGGPDGWRDVISEMDFKAYLKPEGLPGHTFLARASAARSWSMDRPFQLTGGGREGVRGYSQDAFPGGRRLLFSAEDRFPIRTSEILDAGLVLFGDVGRVWGQDVPYGVNSGWRSSVGLGVRLNLPGGALRTMRADFTLPLSGARDAHGVYFRFYTELGGLLQTPKRPGQVERSRWSGIDTDLTTSRSGG